jgi:Large polyvalent protein-associated domain 1
MRSNSNTKIKDTGRDISKGSRVDRYWKGRGFAKEYSYLRTPEIETVSDAPISYERLYDTVVNTYGITGIEFGNWVNTNYRYNYLVGFIVAVYDLSKVVNLPGKTVGVNKLSISFGARGMGRATAHFEPAKWIINLTRFARDEDFKDGGGLGALAHEYGHFLDYFFGTYHNDLTPYRSLTMGRYTTTDIPADMMEGDTLVSIANNIIHRIIWEDQSSLIYSSYYAMLKKKVKEGGYWLRHNELFARAFEQWVQYKLQKKGVYNIFLTKYKYESSAYMKPDFAKKIYPLFDRLVKKMAETIKQAPPQSGNAKQLDLFV